MRNRTKWRGRLHELGIPEGALRDAVQRAYRYVAECTSHDVPSAAGMLAYLKINRELRDILIPHGWSRSDAGNFSTVIAPDGSFAVAVAGGNDDTGLPNGTPTNRNGRGPTAQAAVRVNQYHFSDAYPEVISPIQAPPKPDLQTWFLLHLMDEVTETIRTELSLPAEIVDGHISLWQERLILSPVPFLPAPLPSYDAGNEGDEIDIPVERRVS
jgi:hypothetical protein